MHYIRTVHLTQCGQVWSSEMETPCTYENMNGRAFVARLSPGQENGGNSFYLLLHGGEVCIFLRFSLPSKAGAQCPGTLIGRMAYWCLCGTALQLWMPGGVEEKSSGSGHIGGAWALLEPRSGLAAANLGNMPKQASARPLLGFGDPRATVFFIGFNVGFSVGFPCCFCFLVVLHWWCRGGGVAVVTGWARVIIS